ncbi:50S ribosomal protein L13, chloroplastic-like isoform X2 [Phoenix dactylifera]|uniref:50S ribosomal protein L13, chloroplastic-like isoform X2 n=1 Tax=Phoenix dactylifera TaxID=42345 RepID=A0A8B7C5Q3_PHODC|nr:50S ribosomal protein L13, chloroplastic-like isoform X2 [Phoenix dactylifera]
MAAAIPTSAFLSAVRSQGSPPLSSPTAFALPKTPFLGPSNLVLAVAKPSNRIACLSPRNRFQVLCQEIKVAIVPREQRWMYDESEINGPDIWNKTWYPKAADYITTEKTWYVVDATDKILGRLASTTAIHIRGKNLATYTPSVDMGAYVIVLGRTLFTHLKVYKGPDHPHEAQKPIPLPMRDKRIQVTE